MEPIAIIGIGCRFPGAHNPETFWQILHNGVDAISEVPPTRWDIDSFYDPEPVTPGKMNTRYGGFLERVDQFDPGFFGIAPREAERIDPQQRVVLEVAWEALENAGVVPSNLSGSSTGVFIGIGNYDYGVLLSKDVARMNAYDGTGSTLGLAANRLSYLLNLRGPSLAIETSCSSSLVATHLACQSLQSAESDLCLVGAVSLMLSPEQTIIYSQARMMASDGRCKTFDASADGYVRGEGCGIAVLKRLKDAIRDGDNIQAVIRGTAINQDGLTNGLTAPNGPSQQAVIRQALENAGVEPAQISYVEAHGTGTPLGDPIEVKSLKAVLSEGRSSEQRCWMGSVKTNIGHLEAAAGMAGLLKVVLSLQHKEIPPHLNFKQLNPYISLEGTPFAIPTEIQPWTAGTEHRFAGISSFGFGGTNGHVILEEAPTEEYSSRGASSEPKSSRPLHLLTLSAKSEQALRELAQRYDSFLGSHPELSLADVCFTANTGRSHFEQRLAVVAESTMQLRQQLEAFATEAATAGLASGQVHSSKRKRIAFLFTGQGSQYVGMGRQLYDTQPTFRAALDRCDEILRPYLEKPLLEVLYPAEENSSLLDETAYTQPALFALEYALFELWKSWGIAPAVLMGHSVGEYVAACVAGVFSLEDGLKLIAARGRLIQALPQVGEMVAVMADPASVAAAIAPYGQQIAIAAVNGSRSLVISGERQAVKAVSCDLEAQGVKTKALQVSHAFHSPLMAPMVAEFQQVASEIDYRVPQLKLISNLTGQLVKEEIATPEYWCRHILSPVQFTASMETLQQQGYEVFLEIGSKPTLLGMGRNCLPQEGCLWLPSLRPGQDDWQQILQSLAALSVRGVPVDWISFEQDVEHRRVELPTYPFQRERYWVGDTTANGKHNNGKHNNGLSSDVTQTRIINLLHQGDIHQLTQHLAAELSADEERYLPKLLSVLVRKHQEQVKATSVKDWLYQVEWQLKPRDRAYEHTGSLAKESGSWLILSAQGGVGRSLADHLQQQGQSCLLVYPGEFYQHQGPGTWSINPSSPSDYERLLQEVASSELSLKGVVHLWSLEATQPENLTIPALQQAQTCGCESVLYLMQALVKHDGAASSRLWLVTRGAMPVGSTLPAVAQAPLWGLGKVIALEHAELWGGMLDLAPESTQDEAAALLTEIEDSQGEDHLALRSGQRYVARLMPTQPPEPQGVSLKSDGTYLITGGLGALGLKIAQWMVEQGVRYLVLTGRRGASPQAQETITSIEQTGAKVLVAQADVSDETDMVRVLEDVKASMPPLQGIIHAAGVVGYQAIKDIDLNTFESVLRPKVLGAWILHQLTKEMKLDFFVGFSSIASVWGSKGNAHYAAANHFLDALAYYRQGLGLPALSVNWGPWAEAGMASSEEAQQWLTRMGVKALQPDESLTALGLLLGGDSPQTTVANIDWTRFKGIYEAKGKRPLLEKIETQHKEAAKQQKQQSEILQKLEAAPESDRVSDLIAYLQAEVAAILGLGVSKLPDPSRGFFEMGMDSLMAVELKERLEASLGASLPATLAFESPTIKDLAEYLGKEVLNWKPVIYNTVSQDASSLNGGNSRTGLAREDELNVSVSKIEQLSEDEVEASIAERLAKLESLMKAN